MPYIYLPYCTYCGEEDNAESRASEKNNRGDFLIQTSCASCGTPISVVKAEAQPHLQYKYEPTEVKTPMYFEQLGVDELISEMHELGRLFFRWEAGVEAQGPIDPLLITDTSNCTEEIRRRLRLAEGKLTGQHDLEVRAREVGEYYTPAALIASMTRH